jgi:hypothetical protein
MERSLAPKKITLVALKKLGVELELNSFVFKVELFLL